MPADFLTEFEMVLGDMALVMPEVVEPADRDSILALRARMYDIEMTLRFAISEVDRKLIELHPWNVTHETDGTQIPILLPGGGSVKIQGGNDVKRFDIPALTSALTNAISERVDAKAVVNRDGEMVDVKGLVDDIVGMVIDAAGANAPSFTSFRKTVFRKYKIDVTDYALEVEKSPLSVVVYGRKKEGM